MKNEIFEFTLVLDTVDDRTENLEDHLFDAGCDDALINFRNGTVYLDFQRAGRSLEDTVISAINHIEGSRLNARVISILPDNLVSESEIAARLNKPRQTISLWVKKERRKNTHFPNPVSRLSDKSPLWRWHEVVQWLFQQKIIKDSHIVDSAKFIENINAVLGARDQKIQEYRHHILNKLKESSRTHA